MPSRKYQVLLLQCIHIYYIYCIYLCYCRGFETKCVILWNPKTDICYLEAYWQLEAVTEDRSYTNWNPARYEANLLRKASLGFFDIPMAREVRCLSHEVWSRQVGNISEIACYIFII